MKTSRIIAHVFALLASLSLLGYSSSLRAEDIDVYVSNSTNIGAPNVLFVLYNGADMDADAGASCSYADGTTPSTGGSKVASLVQCALVNAISNLANGSVNIGVVVSNDGSFTTQATTNTAQGGYHDVCSSTGAGGCVVRKLMNMDATGKASMTAFIKGLKPFSGGASDANGVALKVNSSVADPAAAMQEAWAYYNGKTGLSGTVYGPSILSNGCQRNFIVYIGSSAKSISNTAGQAGINATQVGATSAQLTPIVGTQTFAQNICGVSSYPLTSGDDWANEWTRLMRQQDGGASGNVGLQNIITYGVNVEAAANKCSPDTPAMIASMAKQGGGKFYDTNNALDLSSAIYTILNEVQAVNSVFSSASLPVSVNAQGTYLNQIYLGMFRPDPNASPRWLGNLKQYQLVTDSTGQLVLGDTNGTPAISSSGTGFIAPGAVSFWSYKDTSSLPDSIGGMFVNNPEGTPASGYDSPDGEVVEKGGAAQQIRKENLTAAFTGASNTPSTNPRRLYTWCPAGSSCNTNLTDSTNDFATSNGNISSAAFGTSTTLKITSISRNGLTVTATTNGNHGLSPGASVTISGVTPTDYDGTFTLATASGNTFTYSLPGEYPNTTSQGSYTVTKSGTSTPLTGVLLSGTTATVSSLQSLSAFPVGSSVTVAGFDQAEYNGTFTVTAQAGTTLSYGITLSPPTPATNTYQAYYTSVVSRNIAGISTSGSGVNKLAVVTTTSPHGFHYGQTVTIKGTGQALYDNQSFQITALTATTFSFPLKTAVSVNNPTGATVSNSQAPQTVTLTRSGSIATATFGSSPNWFTTGDTVSIAKTGGSAGNEAAYVKSGVTIAMTCVPSSATSCTTFTYGVTLSPASPGTFSGTPSISVAQAAGSVAPGGITRALGSTSATVVQTITSGSFFNGDTVSIAASGSPVSTESAYVVTRTISCTAPCSTFTISGLTVTPSTTGTGVTKTVYSGAAPPDRDTVIKWVRGQDNFGDEAGPGGSVTVRPSVHGDVLHSRPLVVNYGDSRGIVVFYGTNDGVFHAVNGNQSTAIGNVPAGDELWGLVLPEHYPYINRQRIASPELKFPTTQLSTATGKDYFVDGPTGSYQKLNPDGTVNTSYIYLTMRRGGRFIYALDVSTPTAPKFLWRIDANSVGFSELGETWSRPRLTLLQSSTYKTTPVLVFGGGYDPAEDSEPPAADSMGRSVYIINALDGSLIWSASPTCVTSSTCLNVPNMTYAIPSDVTFVDRDLDGYTDKIYVGDVGGNLWRIDVSAAATTSWTVTRVAALGCDTGPCAAGTTPRKFFFPPAVLTVLPGGQAGSYDAIGIISGDREHPLQSTAAGSAALTPDKFFMVRDLTTTISPASFATTDVQLSGGLFDATSTVWDGSLNGFYISMRSAEKGVNAPLAVNGLIFFSTNQPSDPSATCAANLGIARAYAVSPFTSESTNNVLSGGGLPPSPVAGLVSIKVPDGQGHMISQEERFCIGCGVSSLPGTPPSVPGTCAGNAALQNCTPSVTIPSNLKRTYWYKKQGT